MEVPEHRWIVLRPTDETSIEFHEGNDGAVTVLWLVSPRESPDASGRLRVCLDLDKSEIARLRTFLRAIEG